MKQALVIKMTEGVPVANIVPFEKGTLEFYYEQLECETIDIVEAYGLTIQAEIIVDDEGLFKDNAVVNPLASVAYGVFKHGQPIVGNAIICKPYDTGDGIDETGFEPEEINSIMAEITMKLMQGGEI